MPRRKTSGPTQPEGERKAKQRLLRLLPSVDAALDARARSLGLTASAYVSALVMADITKADARSKRTKTKSTTEGYQIK